MVAMFITALNCILLLLLHASRDRSSLIAHAASANDASDSAEGTNRQQDPLSLVWNILTDWGVKCCSDCGGADILQSPTCQPEHFIGPDGRRRSLRILSVPYPSGIVMRQAHIADGGVLRIATLQHSAVQVRKEWGKVYTVPLFSPEQADRLIRMAEEKGSEGGGWGRSYNTGDELPSVDLPVVDIVGAEEYRDLRAFLSSSLLEAMADSFGLNKELIHMRYDSYINGHLALGQLINTALLIYCRSDLHIAKYNASKGAKRSHDLHKDESMFSFVVALNTPRKKGRVDNTYIK